MVQGEGERWCEGHCKDWEGHPQGRESGRIQGEGPRPQGQGPLWHLHLQLPDLGGGRPERGPHLSLTPATSPSPRPPRPPALQWVTASFRRTTKAPPWAPLLGRGPICRPNRLAPYSHPVHWRPQHRCRLKGAHKQGPPPTWIYTQEPAPTQGQAGSCGERTQAMLGPGGFLEPGPGRSQGRAFPPCFPGLPLLTARPHPSPITALIPSLLHRLGLKSPASQPQRPSGPGNHGTDVNPPLGQPPGLPGLRGAGRALAKRGGDPLLPHSGLRLHLDTRQGQIQPSVRAPTRGLPTPLSQGPWVLDGETKAQGLRPQTRSPRLKGQCPHFFTEDGDEQRGQGTFLGHSCV